VVKSPHHTANRIPQELHTLRSQAAEQEQTLHTYSLQRNEQEQALRSLSVERDEQQQAAISELLADKDQ